MRWIFWENVGWLDRSSGSNPGNSGLLLSLLQILGVSLLSLPLGLTAGELFSCEIAFCTPGLDYRVLQNSLLYG